MGTYLDKYGRWDYQFVAPFAWIHVIDRVSGLREDDVPMLLDTGADVTLLPRRPSFGREIPYVGKTYKVDDVGGGRRELPAINVTLSIETIVINSLCLVDDRQEGLLGRNVLNLFRVELDARNKTWVIRT